MEKLRTWIKKKGKIKNFLNDVGMSPSFFYEWSKGKKGLSLQKAAKIVNHTKGEISFEDLADFEKQLR